MKKIILSIAVIAASISLYSFAPKAKNSDAVNFTVTAKKSRVDFTGSLGLGREKIESEEILNYILETSKVCKNENHFFFNFFF